MAERICVVRTGGVLTLVVDGVEIPANAIRRGSVELPVDTDDVPTVRLALTARHVDVVNTLNESETP
mgnify:FL=1